eukprot:GHVS01066354.1.p2 GENE.GHVS01066354.1~~GHVS01066354.1.p2  ORF type:complete len:251 (-),score=46.41 GHVS01066354.1:1564-2316(-)
MSALFIMPFRSPCCCCCWFVRPLLLFVLISRCCFPSTEEFIVAFAQFHTTNTITFQHNNHNISNLSPTSPSSPPSIPSTPARKTFLLSTPSSLNPSPTAPGCSQGNHITAVTPSCRRAAANNISIRAALTTNISLLTYSAADELLWNKKYNKQQFQETKEQKRDPVRFFRRLQSQLLFDYMTLPSWMRNFLESNFERYFPPDAIISTPRPTPRPTPTPRPDGLTSFQRGGRVCVGTRVCVLAVVRCITCV